MQETCKIVESESGHLYEIHFTDGPPMILSQLQFWALAAAVRTMEAGEVATVSATVESKKIRPFGH